MTEQDVRDLVAALDKAYRRTMPAEEFFGRALTEEEAAALAVVSVEEQA